MADVMAWHFVGKTLRNGQKIPRNGRILKWNGPLVMCESGLHASREPFDALHYAPGATLCYVRCGGGWGADHYTEDGKPVGRKWYPIIESDDKLVCRERTIIARMDATELLRYFARMQAVSVIHLWGAPDVVCDYLMTGDEKIGAAASAAARAAAWAARAAAWAASTAAWDAAWAVARDAAWDAARAAAWAASTAAWDAAWALAALAAWDAARNEFNQLVYECFEDYL